MKAIKKTNESENVFCGITATRRDEFGRPILDYVSPDTMAYVKCEDNVIRKCKLHSGELIRSNSGCMTSSCVEPRYYWRVAGMEGLHVGSRFAIDNLGVIYATQMAAQLGTSDPNGFGSRSCVLGNNASVCLFDVLDYYYGEFNFYNYGGLKLITAIQGYKRNDDGTIKTNNNLRMVCNITRENGVAIYLPDIEDGEFHLTEAEAIKFSKDCEFVDFEDEEDKGEDFGSEDELVNFNVLLTKDMYSRLVALGLVVTK